MQQQPQARHMQRAATFPPVRCVQGLGQHLKGSGLGLQFNPMTSPNPDPYPDPDPENFLVAHRDPEP